MYRDDSYIGWQTDTEVSGPWQAFIYDPTSPLRTDEPVNRIYRWKWRSIAASCLESTIRAERLLLPFPVDLFFFSPSPCPSRLNPFPLFLCFPLIPRDRSMRHARTPNITFVCCSVWGRCMDGDERREWKNFAIFIVLREILNSMIKIITSNNNLGAF